MVPATASALATVLLLLGTVAAQKVTFTPSTTTVHAGQPFTAKCNVADYVQKGNETLVIYFARRIGAETEDLVVYHSDEEQHWKLHSRSSDQKDLAISLQNSSFPNCEVTFVASSQIEYEYCCEFTSDSLPYVYYSNYVNVSVQVPVLTFASSVGSVEKGSPFTVSCHLDQYDAANRNYSVRFMSSRSLLATYNVFAPTSSEAKPFVLLEKTQQANITISHGPHSAFPTFDIVLSTSTELNQLYWCSLVEGTGASQFEYKSNIWPTPEVTFSASVQTHEDGAPFTGRCSINHFPEANFAYSVSFYAHAALLATYTVKPNEPVDLTIASSHPNVHVSHGTSMQLPTYELSISFTGESQDFWCTLTVGERAESREYKSNQVTL